MIYTRLLAPPLYAFNLIFALVFALPLHNAEAEVPKRGGLAIAFSSSGLATTELENSKVHFDFDSDCMAERTAWLDSLSGFLVLPDADGKVLDGSHIFAYFSELAIYDKNHDGKIDADDPIYAQLRVWRAYDGKSRKRDLSTLPEEHVTSIPVTPQAKPEATTPQGNYISSYAKLSTDNGQNYGLYEVQFDADPKDAIYRGKDCVSERL